jgi:2-iminoacetate synthase ThiH
MSDERHGREPRRRADLATGRGPVKDDRGNLWALCGPTSAQTALTSGPEDLHVVSGVDSLFQERRCAPPEESRRSIRAASRAPAERDGRFALVTS